MKDRYEPGDIICFEDGEGNVYTGTVDYSVSRKTNHYNVKMPDESIYLGIPHSQVFGLDQCRPAQAIDELIWI